VNGGTVNMATGFGSIDNDTQASVNSQTANASGATAGNVQSVLTVTSGATVNMGALTINRSTKADAGTQSAEQAGTELEVVSGGKLYVESITLVTKEYNDKYQKSSTEELASGSKKTTGYGAVDVASGAVAEVKKDVTVAANTTFDKTGSGAFKVLGTLKTDAATSGAKAGAFNVKLGSVAVNTVANAGTTTVASDASFNVTGTGSVNSGTISIAGTTGTGQDTNTKAGSLTVDKGADFVNTGFISSEKNETTYTVANTGDVIVAGTFTNYGTVDGKTVNGFIGANSLTVEEGGVLNTKITDSYAVAKTTVKGTFNLTELNSSVSGKKTDPKDQLVLAGEMTLDGGLMTLNGQEFTGNVKLGLSKDKPATFAVKGARDYKASQITFLSKGEGESKGSTLTLEKGYEGTYTVGTLDAVHAESVTVSGGTLNVDTKLTTNVKDNTTNVHVGKDGTLALTKTAIGLTVATSGDSAAVADTFKGVQNNGRVLVTGLDGMTVKAATLTEIKNKIVKTNTGFIDFGKLAVDATTVSGYNSTANTLTASGAAILDGMHLDQFKNTTVTGVSGGSNTLNGSFGAVQLTDAAATDGAPASFTVAAGKQVYLNNFGNLVVDKDGKLANVAVGNGSSFVTTGQNAVVGGVNGTSGSFVVESGSLEAKGDVNVADLTVTGALTVNEKAAVPASGSTDAQPAQKYTVTATNLTVEQGGVLNVLHDVTLNSGSGALAVDGTMNVKGVLSANNRTINVGSDNSTGVLTVGTLKDATVFADPAWNNGMEAAQVAVKTLDSGAKVEAGRNSIVAVGTTDITKAQAALAQTGLKLGEVTKGSVGVVNAVAYVTAEPTVTAGVTDYNGTTVGGHVLVSGAKQATHTQSITHGLDVKKGTLAIIDASGFDKSGEIAVFSNSINIDDGATVYLSNLKNGDKLNLTTATRTITDRQTVPAVSVGNANIVFAGDLLMNFKAVKDAAGNETSVYQMSMVDRAEPAKMGAVAGLGAAYGMFAEGVDNNSSSAQFNKWLYTSTTSPMNDGTEEGNFVALQTAAKDVASLGATTGVQTMTMDAVNQMGETVADRVSLLTQRAAGVNVWAAANGGMFEAKSLFDGAGYESDIYSGVLGVDYQFACNAVLGAALTIGTADTDNKNSTVKASTDSDLVGFSVYASKTFADVIGVSADIGYLTASNDVTANGYGQSWKFSQDTDAFTIGLRTEVLAEVGAVKLVPHIGIRYTALSTDGFEAGYKTEIDDQNIFQMPVGVTVSGDFQTGDWTVAPKFDLSFVPTFGDKDADLKLGITGVKATDDLAVRVIDSNPVQATLGVNATNGAWGFGLNYKLGVGSDDRMNNTFNVNVRYAF
ncbi:autotransporter domain-containing protein, partial [Duodenibacillus massiliensis]|uniref:autotransporter domain-containing protein n=1 Tax=Duodenibacillus massiliensis TaxID=1852381 RepID=UPI003F7D6936